MGRRKARAPGAAGLRLLAACCWGWFAPSRGAAPYSLKESYVGPDFFSKFAFWSSAETPDPTHGAVEYLDEAEALARGMIQAAEGEVFMSVDTREFLLLGQGRGSVRIQSRNAYNAGLFVLRLSHAPVGCGVWPAFWMYGEDAGHLWPTWGEFDIIEGVHMQEHTRTTLHTGRSCSQEALVQGYDFAGKWEAGSNKTFANICDIDAVGQYEKQGCSQRGPLGSFGAPLNKNGGGTYAAEWDPVSGHIRTWFWPPGEEPADLKPGSGVAPFPDGWDLPFSHFKLDPSTCPPQHFRNMRIVFNIELCGDYGNGSWAWACPDLAKTMTCSEYVASYPEDFVKAHWTISALDVYEQDLPLPAGLGQRIMVNFQGAQPRATLVGHPGMRIAAILLLGLVAAAGAASALWFEYRTFRTASAAMQVSEQSRRVSGMSLLGPLRARHPLCRSRSTGF